MSGKLDALAVAGALALAAVTRTAIGTGALHLKNASAAFPNQLPFMCFNTAHTFHQTFGPNSFFLNENQQGPTGFLEGSPASKPTVTFPLRRGTAAGHLVYYFITDASDQSVARALGVDFTPKLVNAAGTSTVQHSTSSDATSIAVAGDVDFSPVHVLVAGPTGIPPPAPPPRAGGHPRFPPPVPPPSADAPTPPPGGGGAHNKRPGQTAR